MAAHGGPGPNRRDFLRLGGGAALGLAMGACSSNDATGSDTSIDPDVSSPPLTTTPPTATGELAALTPADFEALATCRLFPESTAGPFPLEEQLVRRDITEGYAGHPVRLGLRVVDESCAPVAGAAVEVWHTDATGDYSAFADRGGGKDEAEGTTFCRGTQLADADGIAELHTIYPGWYPGRAVHIHLRVRVDDDLLLTGQLYFDDAYTEGVLAEGVYAAFGPPSTTNDTDGIAGDPAADGSLLSLVPADTVAGPGTLALLNVGVSR